jgi:hypothetical protein
MKNLLWIRVLFVIAALYDGVLGLMFLFAGRWVYDTGGTTPPNHWAYVQFPALLLLIFGAMFAMIARRPVEHRNLIPFGIALKLAYSGLALYYWLTIGIPWMWQPFVIIDVLMAVLFFLAAVQLMPQPTTRTASQA